MAKQIIDLGTPPSGVGGDTPRSANVKINENFTELYNRNAQLGTASNKNFGLEDGQLLEKGAFGLGRSFTNSLQLLNSAESTEIYPTGIYRYNSGTTGRPTFGSTFGVLIELSALFSGGANYGAQLGVDYAVSEMGFRCLAGPSGFSAWRKIYHTGNTTMSSQGVLSAASPVVRIASVADSLRTDLTENSFEVAGEWGVANDEAVGVVIERTDLGVYKITGSLGLALEGWRTKDPHSPDGGRSMGLTESFQEANGTVWIKLFKQKWTLTDDGEMILGKGAPIDVPLNSWIDVRLSMPTVELDINDHLSVEEPEASNELVPWPSTGNEEA